LAGILVERSVILSRREIAKEGTEINGADKVVHAEKSYLPG
jgi:hypothetical protein